MGTPNVRFEIVDPEHCVIMRLDCVHIIVHVHLISVTGCIEWVRATSLPTSCNTTFY